MGVELCERNHSSVSHERYSLFMGNLSQGSNVRHLHLRVCNDFHEDARRVIVYGILHLLQVSEVGQMRLYSKPHHCASYEGVGVAKEVS